jgi:hypothetical protein
VSEETSERNEDVRVADKRDVADRLSTAGWGLLFLWLGIVFLTDLREGVALLGIGIIILTVQGIRRSLGLDLEGFWVVVGLVFGLTGVGQLVALQISLLPILLIAAGLALLLSSIRSKHPSRSRRA